MAAEPTKVALITGGCKSRSPYLQYLILPHPSQLARKPTQRVYTDTASPSFTQPEDQASPSRRPWPRAEGGRSTCSTSRPTTASAPLRPSPTPPSTAPTSSTTTGSRRRSGPRGSRAGGGSTLCTPTPASSSGRTCMRPSRTMVCTSCQEICVDCVIRTVYGNNLHMCL